MLMPIMKNLCNRIGSEARRRHELKNTGKAIQVNDVNGFIAYDLELQISQ